MIIKPIIYQKLRDQNCNYLILHFFLVNSPNLLLLNTITHFSVSIRNNLFTFRRTSKSDTRHLF